MLSSEAVVDTDDARRYLAQLCGHFAHKAERRPSLARVEYDGDEHGCADFGWGTCDMRAEPQYLLLRAEAPDAEGLGRVQQLVGSHLERFGGDDGLVARWSPAASA